MSLDLVLFGATGYVGQLVAQHLAGSDARIGLAGRSKEKLEQVRDSVDRDWPLLVVDAEDPAELVASARVVCTTVGPYARYGWPLVKACAESGTHYLDLTGEVLFVRRAIDELHETAVSTGARLVPSCGYDSIPSDLGVHLLHQAVRADGEGELGRTVLTAAFRGGVSGGTVDSLRHQVDSVKGDLRAQALVADPHALCPDPAAEPRDEPADRLPVGRTDEGRWTAPFVMAQYNTRVVRRTDALLGHAYGPQFRYAERMDCGTGLVGPVVAGVTAAVVPLGEAAFGLGPLRAVLDRVLPKPGTGPSEEARRKGWFRSTVDTTTTTGARYRSVVAGTGDPGYAATAVMMGESALSLALDDLSTPAGVLTPAVAMGDALVERLRGAGLELTASPR